jgi:hypothetical protein
LSNRPKNGPTNDHRACPERRDHFGNALRPCMRIVPEHWYELPMTLFTLRLTPCAPPGSFPCPSYEVSAIVPAPAPLVPRTEGWPNARKASP